MSVPLRGSLADSASLRRANTDLVTATLRDHGPITRSELTRLTGLTRPTITAIVQALIASDIVHERPPSTLATTKGRPPSRLDLNPRRSVVATCIFRLSGVHVRVLDIRGTLLAETIVDVSDIAVVNARVTLERVARAVDELATAVPGAGQLTAVSVVVAGLINTTSGVCVAFPPFKWVDVPIRATLEHALSARVTVLNPSHAAVLGEVMDGSAVGSKDVVMIFYDNGISAGIVSGGELVTGAIGATGELGHCRMSPPRDDVRPAKDQVCSFGHRDCLEARASGARILRRSRAIAGRRATRAPTIAALAALHHPDIDLLLDEAARDLATATSWLVNLLNPSVVVFGGTPFTQGADEFLDTFTRHVRDRSLVSNQAELAVRQAHPDADARGACHAALGLLRD